ncbi:plastocyanin/azurin family copper-binding protein [Streptomyces sp. NPDC048751]|uniref:cupredoxin domain-containing protein n=1 Tax=Streptomyces sp. NPDC048751 TaxID=3365591 RepID=UPI00371A6C35
MPRLTLLRGLLAALFMTGAVTVLPGAVPPAHAATAHQVLMSGYAFSPRSLTIAAGDTVTWTNQDQAPHDVKTTSGPASLHSPMLNKGGTWSHTFTTPGTYGYVCTVHPGMTAQLVVKAAAAPPPTAHPTAHQHATSAPDAGRPAAQRRSTTASAPHADHSGMAAAEAHDSPSPSPSPSAAAGSEASPAPTQPAVAAQSDASAVRPLDPLLLLAGIVAGVAVLCLLLVGSRSAATASRTGDPGPG